MGGLARSLNPFAHAPDNGAPAGEPRDLVGLGIAVAAVILFIGIGGQVMPQALRSWLGLDRPPDVLLTIALLLQR